MDLYNERKEFNKSHLRRADLSETPEPLFEVWFKEAQEACIEYPNAMILATVDNQGKPFQRTVLLKAFDESGLVFFGNLKSRKAHHIEQNNHVNLLFFWRELERQVSFSGVAEPLSEEENASYFHSRPRESQLAAIASHQSEVIADRDVLTKKYEALNKAYPNEVPAPNYWGGYKVKCDSVEFWQGSEFRLHDRFLYTKDEEHAWKIDRLAP